MNIDIENLSLVGQGNYSRIEAGLPVYDELEQITQEPMKTNEALLMEIIHDNANTEFGKKHGFSEIKTIKDYQEKVPVSIYDDYVDYILRMTEDGEDNLICSYPVNHYNKSSGTMGNPKRLPMSDKSIG